MAPTPRIFSGMQPTGTGELHLGNYLGALSNWVRLTNEGKHEAIFCVVDSHSTTVEYDAKEMPRRVFGTALSYLAAGLDPDRCILFVQSQVPEHTELAWYLGTVTALGDLNRMTQFKDKSEQNQSNVNAGLFTYPILMAADILVYKATAVPVGEDQVQHLELSREICRRFNRRFGDIFPEPKAMLTKTSRIMGLDGKTKMSKSRGNSIDLFDSPKSVEKKLKSAFTDEQKLRLGDPGRPEICNVFTMHTALTAEETVVEIGSNCRSGALGCGDCKKQLTESINRELEPIQARAEALRREPKRVLEILQDGGAAARKIAANTLEEVRDAMGLRLEVPKT
ncbi:MAG: tryptophan--tRNA ligase [Polyangiaceae bacterium]